MDLTALLLSDPDLAAIVALASASVWGPALLALVAALLGWRAEREWDHTLESEE